MRRLCTSSGVRRLCAEGAESPCCVHRLIPTKSRTRIELEQQTYADSNVVHEPSADFLNRISGLQALLENAPPLPDREMLWHRALEELLDGARDGSELLWRLRSETEPNSRNAHSNRRAGKVERPDAHRGNVYHQRREWLDLNSPSRHQSISIRKCIFVTSILSLKNSNQQRVPTLLKPLQPLYAKIGLISNRSKSVSKEACPSCFLRVELKRKNGKSRENRKIVKHGKRRRSTTSKVNQGFVTTMPT